MTASPLVQVQFSSDPGNWHDTPGGVDIVSGNTVSIRLKDTTGVGAWYVTVVGIDEFTATPPLLVNVSTNPDTPGLVVSPTSIVSFTAPAGPGRAYIFRSSVNGPSLAATFGVFVRTSDGFRVGAVGERFEGDPVFGWTTTLNQFIRSGGGGGGGPASALLTTTGNVDVSGASSPTPGEVLTAVDSTHATWQLPTPTLLALNNLTPLGSFSTLQINAGNQLYYPTLSLGVLTVTIPPAGTWSLIGNPPSDLLLPSEIQPGSNIGFLNPGGANAPLIIQAGLQNVKAVALVDIGFGTAPFSAANFDGVADLQSGDRVLLYKETSFSPGIYTIGDPNDPLLTIYQSYNDGLFTACGTEVYVEKGEVFGGKVFKQTAQGTKGNITNQVWVPVLGPDIAPPLYSYNSNTLYTIDTVLGPPADGYDLILVVDNTAVNSGGTTKFDRGAVTYRRASGSLSQIDDSRSLTTPTFFTLTPSGNSVLIRIQVPSGGPYTFRIRAWYEYVRVI